MLRTFDENLVITAVQQLTTDLDSLSGRIKKLEEGGGDGGWTLIVEKTYENLSISENTTTFDTIKLPQGFLLSPTQLMITVVNYDSEEPDISKLIKNISYTTNLAGALSGSLSTSNNHALYYSSTGVLSQNVTVGGLYVDRYKPASEEITLSTKTSVSYSVTNATAHVKIYIIELPA